MDQFNLTLDSDIVKGLCLGHAPDAQVPLLEDILNQILEASATEAIGAGKYELTEQRKANRNRSNERSLKTRIGIMTPDVPRPGSGEFSHELFERYQRAEQALVLTMMEMVLQDVSTGKGTKIREELCGTSLSKATVSQLYKGPDEAVQAFARPLEKRYPLVMVDAMYLKVREPGPVPSKALMIAMGVNEEGYREVLGFSLWDRETHPDWKTFFEDLKKPGIGQVDYVISDAHTGLVQALQEVKIDDITAVHFIQNKVKEITDNLEIHTLAGNTLEYIIQKNEHHSIITYLSSEGKYFVSKNQDMIRDRVSEKSYFFIPKLVDDKIADKVSRGLVDFFLEVEKDANHPLRKEITEKLENFAKELKTKEHWKNELKILKKEFLNDEKIKNYAGDIWEIIKQNILKELQTEKSSLKIYLKKNLNELALNLQVDEVLQNKIDYWVRNIAEEYILKNTHQFGKMISFTVGNWDGRELSEKMEIEVGKDLQYVRISGTIVGGTVGFLIYIIVHYIF